MQLHRPRQWGACWMDKLAAGRFPTTDGRTLIPSRDNELNTDQKS